MVTRKFIKLPIKSQRKLQDKKLQMAKLPRRHEKFDVNYKKLKLISWHNYSTVLIKYLARRIDEINES